MKRIKKNKESDLLKFTGQKFKRLRKKADELREQHKDIIQKIKLLI